MILILLAAWFGSILLFVAFYTLVIWQVVKWIWGKI